MEEPIFQLVLPFPEETSFKIWSSPNYRKSVISLFWQYFELLMLEKLEDVPLAKLTS